MPRSTSSIERQPTSSPLSSLPLEEPTSQTQRPDQAQTAAASQMPPTGMFSAPNAATPRTQWSPRKRQKLQLGNSIQEGSPIETTATTAPRDLWRNQEPVWPTEDMLAATNDMLNSSIPTRLAGPPPAAPAAPQPTTPASPTASRVLNTNSTYFP